MHADEKELLERIFQDEPGAFEQLLTRYRSLVYSVLVTPGFDFPRDYLDDVFQSFVIALKNNNYHRLRAFEGRNSCALATFLQVVATRFALDERRKWRRQPRAYGQGGDDDEPTWEVADTTTVSPENQSLAREELDTFHNLLFMLDWKRISAVLWVFREIERERIAVVMATSRANIDALYKRAKDQMTELHDSKSYPRRARLPDPRVLTPAVAQALKLLLPHPVSRLHEALLQPGAKRRALVGLVVLDYPRFRCTLPELAKLADSREEGVEAAILSVLSEVADLLGAATVQT
ncbi:MAG: RNA polymerase sigma factor [Planctomycetota bacterium]